MEQGRSSEERQPVSTSVTRWHLRQIERLLWGIFLMAAFTAVFFARSVLLPLVLGLLIALTLSPPVRTLRRAGVPRYVSAPVLVLCLIAGTLLIGWTVSGPLSTVMEEAPTIGDRLQYRLSALSESVEKVKKATEDVQNLTDSSGGEKAQQVELRESSLVSSAMGSVAAAGSSAGIALVIAMFLLAGWEAIQLKLVNAMGTFHDKRRAILMIRDIERQISRYLAAITLINAGLGICVGGAMYLLGMPSAWLWGLAAFLLNFLPYLGALIGILASAAVALLTFDTVSGAAVVPATYLFLTAMEGQFVTPMLVGRRLELNALAVFLTVMFWGWLWGVPGALMAVPFLVFLKVICDHVEQLRVLGTFLSGGEGKDSELKEDIRAVAKGKAEPRSPVS